MSDGNFIVVKAILRRLEKGDKRRNGDFYDSGWGELVQLNDLRWYDRHKIGKSEPPHYRLEKVTI